VEGDLKRIEEVVGEIVAEFEYLRSREMSLRDTNESTNERVKWFAIGTMFILLVLGGWQVVYLRAYFRYVMYYPLPNSSLIIHSGRSISFKPSLILLFIDITLNHAWRSDAYCGGKLMINKITQCTIVIPKFTLLDLILTMRSSLLFKYVIEKWKFITITLSNILFLFIHSELQLPFN
jgi:hypothetical protein